MASHQAGGGSAAPGVGRGCGRGVHGVGRAAGAAAQGRRGYLREVGRALLQEGPAALVRLLGQVEEHRGVAGQLLEAGQAVGVRVEGALQHADGGGALGQDLLGPGDALVLEPLERHDGVDEAHVERLLRRVLAAEVPDLARLLVADDARQQGRTVAAVEAADLGAGLAEDGVLGGDGQVADDVQHVAAADGVAVDEGDDDDGQRADEPLQVEDVEAGGAVRGDVAALALDGHVAAGAEGRVAGAGEEHHADRGVVADVPEGVDELAHGLRPEGVADVLAVDGDLGDAACPECS